MVLSPNNRLEEQLNDRDCCTERSGADFNYILANWRRRCPRRLVVRVVKHPFLSVTIL